MRKRSKYFRTASNHDDVRCRKPERVGLSEKEAKKAVVTRDIADAGPTAMPLFNSLMHACRFFNIL